MQWTHCLFCYSPLETQEVTPCFICGGFPESIRRLAENPADRKNKFTEYELPDGRRIVICPACEVEEFLADGGWGWNLGFSVPSVPLQYLRYLGEIADPETSVDKYCNNCHLRLAFMKVLAERENQSGDD
jgi:hypothetical protein